MGTTNFNVMKNNLQFKNFELDQKQVKSVKGGNIDFGNTGTGSTGFINWDEVDPRDNGFTVVHDYATIAMTHLKKKS